MGAQSSSRGPLLYRNSCRLLSSGDALSLASGGPSFPACQRDNFACAAPRQFRPMRQDVDFAWGHPYSGRSGVPQHSRRRSALSGREMKDRRFGGFSTGPDAIYQVSACVDPCPAVVCVSLRENRVAFVNAAMLSGACWGSVLTQPESANRTSTFYFARAESLPVRMSIPCYANAPLKTALPASAPATPCYAGSGYRCKSSTTVIVL